MLTRNAKTGVVLGVGMVIAGIIVILIIAIHNTY